MRAAVRVSSSALMAQLFGEDLAPVQPRYDACIDSLASRHPAFSSTWNACRGRAGFLLPHMAVEYAHEAVCEAMLPDADRDAALSLGLQVLAVCVDDDVADGQAGGLSERVASVCVAELLQAESWLRLEQAGARAPQVRSGLLHFLDVVTRYQQHDARHIERAIAGDFRLDDYLDCTHKAGSLVEAGLRLGLDLAGADPDQEPVKRFARGFGLAFQLVDDVRDLDEDLASYGAPVTLPMLCVHQGRSLERVYRLADDALRDASAAAARLGPGQRLGELASRLSEVVGKLRYESGRAA